MMQRCTDAEMVRLLARRNGYEAFVERKPVEVQPGASAGDAVVGHFHRARPDEELQEPGLSLFPREAPTLIELRATWSSHGPTRMKAWHIDERTRRIRSANVDDPEYGPDRELMGTHSRHRIVGDRIAQVLPSKPDLESVGFQVTDVPHDDEEVKRLALAAFREEDWFVRARGTVRADRYGGIVRPRRPIELEGAGRLLNGRWYVLGVRHRWGMDPDVPEEEPVTPRYEADVTLVRNALGGTG